MRDVDAPFEQATVSVTAVRRAASDPPITFVTVSDPGLNA